MYVKRVAAIFRNVTTFYLTRSLTSHHCLNLSGHFVVFIFLHFTVCAIVFILTVFVL